MHYAFIETSNGGDKRVVEVAHPADHQMCTEHIVRVAVFGKPVRRDP